MAESEPIPRGERTQAEIEEAAHQLFLKNGYHGTSMRQIAEEAGIAVGGIYNHFASKDEIFLAVVKAYHPYVRILPAMAGAQGETLEDFVRDAAHRMVSSIHEQYDFINLMFIELVEFKGQHVPQLFEMIYPQIMEFAQRLPTKQGNLRSIPLPVIVRAFIGLFFSYILTELLIGNQLPPEMKRNSLDYFVDIYLYGILENEKPGAEGIE